MKEKNYKMKSNTKKILINDHDGALMTQVPVIKEKSNKIWKSNNWQNIEKNIFKKQKK